jgi:hypothetical protein
LVFNAKIVVGGLVTGIHWIVDTRRVRVWIQIHTHERLWVRVWVEFCLVGMDSRTIYPCTTRPIAIPTCLPPAAFPPFAFRLAPTHLGWGTRRQFTRRSRDPPGFETPTDLNGCVEVFDGSVHVPIRL